jgi:group II intron reverse transcriptase/maturase
VQYTATILNAIQNRGKYNLPLQNGTYRMLYNQNLYLRAYGRLYSNQGAMTPGVKGETADGTSLKTFDTIIDALRNEKYVWTPARRVYIPKPNGKKRPLGMPDWSDKILQEVLRSLLEAYYEPNFSDQSHGFRPNRSPRTALIRVQKLWTGSRWWIEGDIESYFDTIDHDVLMNILRRDIHDQRLLRLIKSFLEAGYMEDWKWINNTTGVPQGGVLSPLLSNIYLNELDTFVETVLIPKYTRGDKRQISKRYQRLYGQLYQLRKREERDFSREKELAAEIRSFPSGDPLDTTYRRLRYIRYADDFLLGFIGTKTEAEQIKVELTEWISDHLKLKLNDDKTLITHAGSQPARFLGYDVIRQNDHNKLDPNGKRTINGNIGLRVPATTVSKYKREYMKGGKIIHIPMLVPGSEYAMFRWYQSRLQGIVNYYSLAYNVSTFWQLHSAMQYSLLKTLAAKHKTSANKEREKYRAVVDNNTGRMAKCLEYRKERGEGKDPLVARFGGIPIRRDRNADIQDFTPQPYINMRTEVEERMLAEECKMCGAPGVRIEMHHVRALKDLNKKGRKARKPWEIKMSAMRRKTLAVCRPCHLDITYGRFDKNHVN